MIKRRKGWIEIGLILGYRCKKTCTEIRLRTVLESVVSQHVVSCQQHPQQCHQRVQKVKPGQLLHRVAVATLEYLYNDKTSTRKK